MVTPPATDLLIIGSGAAGLTLVLACADHCQVAVISKEALETGATASAQGGISAVLAPEDSFDTHAEDTIKAGGGLCHPEVVKRVIERGPEAIHWLESLGMEFTRSRTEDGHQDYHLTQEGGHSRRRVAHTADATGKELELTLLEQIRIHPNITAFDHHVAVDLITSAQSGMADKLCLGAYILDRKVEQIFPFAARCTVLATGGASKVYLYTSNPDCSTGDGIALAWRAGCRVGNLEFIQFHPTCLFHPKAKSFLITEAIRGEGGKLLLPNGDRFMPRFDERAELAPRDIVARAIDHEMKQMGFAHVLLDISHKPAAFIERHFPTVYGRCRELGFDMTQEPIPVVPAAHYTCGGVVTDGNGRTDLANLYAVGEVAFTGLHGANRMASNSLLECLVFAKFAAEDIVRSLNDLPVPQSLPSWDESQVTDSDEEVVVSHNWDELRRFMWDYVGIVRTNKRLERARRRVELLQQEIADYYGNFRVSSDLLELRNLAQVAELIIESALARKESRGLHYTLDYPTIEVSQPPADTILTPKPC